MLPILGPLKRRKKDLALKQATRASVAIRLPNKISFRVIMHIMMYCYRIEIIEN
jgi:hypothetical protein